MLSEQHPREQGLKHRYDLVSINTSGALSEQHPREQGLKRDVCEINFRDAALFQSNIQENKD